MFSSASFALSPRAASRSLAALAACVGLLACAGAMAQPKQGEGAEGGRKGPPAEALSACQSAKSGDSCSFSSPNGTVSGSCMAPQGRPLACAPAQGQGAQSSSAPRQ